MRCVTIELAICAAFFSFGSIGAVNAGTGDIRVSGRYFADETGKSWIPVGCNICFDRNAGGSANTRDLYDRWMTKFATNGGNYMRVWLSAPFVEVMPERAYEFSAEATDNLKWLVARAETLGIKLKFTFENFRRVGPRTDMDASKGIISFRNPVYAPYAKTMCDVFTLPKCFDIYLAKVRHIAEAVGKSDALVAVELKKGAFKPIYLGQLNLYLQILDDSVRTPHENPPVGIILCQSADKPYVEYAIRDYNKPLGVATYRTADEMPENLKRALPPIDELRRRLALAE